MPLTTSANQARLKLAPTAGSVQYNLYQRGQAIRAGAPTAGQTAAAAARTAEANSQGRRGMRKRRCMLNQEKAHKEPHREERSDRQKVCRADPTAL